ncbi:MAG: hypothetical protein FWF03_00500, partial [Defluviitaleaceae bacterium]|nr:hypothetical protein [Defluviitaleaceae bacterium]
MKKGFVTPSAVLLALILAFAGCGGSGGSDAEAKATATPTVAENAAEGETEDEAAEEDIAANSGDFRTRDYTGTTLKYIDS